MKTSSFIGFGEDVEGYAAPVLNEREIRASAGILFVFMFLSLMLVLFNNDFLLIKYVISIFLADLLIRVFINPKFAPTMIIGRFIVSKQTPEYVGAAQKKFAWKIGIAFSGVMFILLVILNAYSIITSSVCFICLAFLFFESAFGICLGCLVHGWFYKDKTQYCAGELCDRAKKQPVQKITRAQVFILLVLIVFVIAMIVFFNDQFSQKPKDLRSIINLQ